MGRSREGELGEPSLIGTKWGGKEPGKIQGERKTREEKSQRGTELGEGFQNRGRIHPRTQEAPRGDLELGRQTVTGRTG